MTTNQIPNPKMQFFTAAGVPLVGGKLYTYAAGTTTPLATYTDINGGTANTNPIILDSRGEASVWFGSAQYYLVLTDATDVQIWTQDNLNGVNQPTVDYLTGLGSSLISYAPSGYGAVTTTVQAKLQQYVSVFDFMTTAQITDVQTAAGILDVAAAIMTATTACVTSGKALFFPAGTYTCTTITAQAGMKWVGESSITTIIKLKSGTNANLVNSPTSTIDDLWIEGIRFNGNSAGNTSGDTLVLSGQKPTLIDVVVLLSAGNAITTSGGISFRDTGFEGYFSHIVIDQAQKSGWLHSGPSDSHFDQVMIIDASQKTNNAYYGLYLDPTGNAGSNGRFNNLHVWNRSNVTNIAIAGVYVGYGGNTFTNSHFEGSNLPLNIVSNFNTFASCAFYAPRGSYAVSISSTASSNYLDGAMGLTYYSGNQYYTGVNLAGVGNTLNLTAGGAITAINFASSQYNFVRVSGYIDTGGAAYTGTPASTDNVLISLAGPGGGSYSAPWISYTPTLSSGTGALTSASATGRYTQTNKTVTFQIAVTITTNGTGATYVGATLPFQAAAQEYIVAGRNNTTGKMLQGDIIAGATVMRIFDYANVYPAADGQILYVSGTYQSV